MAVRWFRAEPDSALFNLSSENVVLAVASAPFTALRMLYGELTDGRMLLSLLTVLSHAAARRLDKSNYRLDESRLMYDPSLLSKEPVLGMATRLEQFVRGTPAEVTVGDIHHQVASAFKWTGQYHLV